jgi:hypothetical protein
MQHPSSVTDVCRPIINIDAIKKNYSRNCKSNTRVQLLPRHLGHCDRQVNIWSNRVRTPNTIFERKEKLTFLTGSEDLSFTFYMLENENHHRGSGVDVFKYDLKHENHYRGVGPFRKTMK